jgi:hypothetical protein
VCRFAHSRSGSKVVVRRLVQLGLFSLSHIRIRKLFSRSKSNYRVNSDRLRKPLGAVER